MKMYEPKLKLGDKVWIMQLNKPVEVSINEICITYTERSTTVRYTVTGGHTLLECTNSMPGDFIFTSKKALLDHLYENS